VTTTALMATATTTWATTAIATSAAHFCENRFLF